MSHQGMDLSRRLLRLPADKRRIFLNKLTEQGLSLAALPIPAEEAGELAPASYQQQRLWFIHQLEPDSSAYHLPGAVHLTGPLDRAALQQALDTLAQRHHSLRTVFTTDGEGQPLQRVLPPAPVLIETRSGIDEADLQLYAEAFARRPFDLVQGPLWRVELVSLGEHDHRMLLCLHHSIADGWSIQILLMEFAQCYRAAVAGQSADLPALAVQYGDVARWQRCALEAGGADADLAYWLDQLQGELPVLELPTDRPRPPQQSFRGERHHFTLDAGLAAGLKALARSRGTSLFTVVLAAFKVLLFRLSNQDDLCVGVPIAGRNRAEVENLIGFFVNTQALRSRLDGAESFDELLSRVQQIARQAQVHQELPFEYLVDHLQPERSLSHHPLFQVLYNHQQRGQERFELAPGLNAELMPQEAGAAQFDLALHTWEFSDRQNEQGSVVAGNWNYATDLFDEDTVVRLHQQFVRLLGEIVAVPEQAIGEYGLLDEADRRQLTAWNDTFTDHGTPEPVHRRFERLAQTHPQRPALIFGGQQLSYGELNTVANRLAHYLIGQGVGPDSLVGVAAERSTELVIALYAIHKAGAAYVPIDPDHPPARQQQILASAGIDLLLTLTAVADRLPEPGPARVIPLDTLDLSDQPDTTPAVDIHPQQRAYVLYTSGSTGQPKGVANTHSALYNRLMWMQSAYPLEDGDTVLQKTPYSFDVSVWEFFWPLMTGARLVLAQPGDHKDPARLSALIRQAQVTTIHFVPSMLSAFLAQPDLSDCASLRRILCSGEALPKSLQDQTLSRLPQANLYNLYGPTEAAIDVTHWTCEKDDRPTVPIGRPIDNLQIHILDPRLNEQPVGVPGELYIGGAGLAREYHRRPDLTADRFIPSPFRKGERLYRSGDLARWCRDGTVEYLGRLDHQIKLRGQRIELGEIEGVLREQSGVGDAVVLARDERLVGYLQGEDLDRDAILMALKSRLPDYMVPAHLVTLAAFPLSANGKLDRKALPQPELETARYEAPRNDTEQMLAGLWQEVLGLNRVGRNDNFFALGGDSILSLRIVARAQSLGYGLTPRDLFERQTIAELATAVQPLAQTRQHEPDLERAFALTPIQQWFFEQPMQQRSHWNQSLLLRPVQPLQTGALARALNAVINHHDALRLVFSEEQGSWSQRYRAPADDHDVFWQRTCTPEDLPALFEQVQTSLDIINGPLIRAVYVRLPDASERLLLAIHHLVVDGVSWRILLDDLITAYEQACNGSRPELGIKGASFQSWSDRLVEWSQAGVSEAERAWWSAIPQPPPLPGTRHDGANTVACQEQQTLVLDHERTGELLTKAPRAFRTGINDLLLTALGQTLQQWAGVTDPVIALESHGRDHDLDGPDLTRSVGWFTSLYPVQLRNGGDLITSLKATKEVLRTVPRNGLGYGVLRYLQGEPDLPDLSRAIAFNYLGQLDRGDEAPMVLADESPGPMRGADAPLGFELAIDGQVRNGCLELVYSYSRERHDGPDVAALMTLFGQALDDVLAMCRDHSGLTPSDVPLAGLDQSALDQLPLPAGEIDDILPLTPMQQGLLFHSELDDGTGLYINQVSVAIDHLPVAAFKAAWGRAVARHPVLRAGFMYGPGSQVPLQVIQQQARLAIREIDGRSGKASVDALQEQERTTPFDLTRPPLMRLLLVRLTDSRWQMIWTLHHILVDGWSSAALLSEILQDTLGAEPPPPPRYRDYFHWLLAQNPEQSEAFWRHQLENLNEPTRLAPLLKRSRAANLPGGDSGQPETGEIALTLDRSRLEAFARQQQVTLNTLVQAAWVLLLQRYTGQRQVIFGATVAGRPSAVKEMDRQIGLFINTLPVVQAPSPGQRVSDWLAELQASSLALQEHGHTPLYRIQQLAGQSGQALFDSLLVFENFPVDKALRGNNHGPQLTDLSISERTHYPVSLSVESSHELVVRLHYRTEQVDSEAAGQLALHLQHMLDSLVLGAEERLGDIPLVTGPERRFWQQWNHPVHPPVDPRPICALIADQARTRPEAVALVHGDQRLTFAEFNARSNQLAYWLIRQDIGAESRVGVALERSVDMLVALFAVHKVGAAYVPLDPDYPPSRLRYMLEDSGASLLLSHSAAWDRLPQTETPRVNLDELDLCNEPTVDPEIAIHPDQLAYLIYTSGSTGQPKGVAVPHGGLSMHCQTIGARYRMTSDDRELHFLSISFDGAHERWLTALSHGARIVLRDQALWSVQQTYDCLRDEGITVAAFPPGYLRQLSEWAELKGDAPGLRVLCFAGEAFSRTMMHHAIRHLKPQIIINGYGPTETVVTPTLWQVSAETADFESAYAPIGDLVGDRQGYVLDDHLNLLPSGIAGELYLGGALARGYLDRSAATAERFVPNPFRRGERLYRTGDRVRLNRDGQLEYLGRLDQQIKLRGYRIETGEVEAALKACPGVRDVVALVRDTSAGPRLVGYVCGEELDEKTLKARLKESLPDYMVPSHLVMLERLPLLPNGKLDRNALPEPQVEVAVYEAPASVRERQLAAFWEELLQRKAVGRNDHFFELGGHSLLATQLVSRVRHELAVDLPLRAVFEAPVLADLAIWLDDLEATAEDIAIPALGLTEAPQSFAQQRLWFLDQLEPGITAYNLPVLLRLTGELDEIALEAAFRQLARRHDVLRIRLAPPEPGTEIPRQIIIDELPLSVERLDLCGHGSPEIALNDYVREFMVRPFQMENGPLWRAALVQLANKDWRLLICMHHAITDGSSVPVLIRELAHYYQGAVTGDEQAMEPLPIQYADFAVWQRQWLGDTGDGSDGGGEAQRQLAYWRKQLGDTHPVLELPTDRPRPPRQSFRGARHRFAVPDALTTQLRELARAEGATLFMVLLTAFNTLLHRLSSQSDLRVGVPVAGRTRRETEGLIGFFVNTQVLRSEVDSSQGFSQLLGQVREACLEAQAHQDLPFERLVEALQPERSLSHNPLFQVVCDHQQQDHRLLTALPGVQVEVQEIDDHSTQFDLALNTVEDADGRLAGNWNYVTDLFDEDTVVRLHQQFERLLAEIVAAPERAIGDYELLDEADRRQLATWNDTFTDHGTPEPVHRRFERLAQAHPQRPALIFGRQQLSYGELNAVANRLAHYLIGQGVGPDSLVGVAAERSIELVVALYAIHKAGAAYVPIDPDHPPARQQQILASAGIDLLLTHTAVADRLPEPGPARVIPLDTLDLSDQPDTTPAVDIHPQQRAYVLYTSGSTGQPKGVANTHSALYNRLMWMQSAYPLEDGDTVLQKTPYSFDVSVWEFFWPLMTGARLVLAQPGDHKDPARLSALIRQAQVTTIHFVPSMLSAFLAQPDLSDCASLRRILCSGEALPKSLQDQTLSRLPQANLYNLYGPTEAAIDVTHWTCEKDDRPTVPIGRPIDNLQIHILDPRLNEQPVGVPGELYIGGAGLAREYHRRPDLTADRFIPSPFRKGERLYRSGDLARWCRDGTVEYLGRLDHQIKLRGQRIELGEIEAVLREQPGVQDAVVVARDERLVGYLQGEDLDRDAILTALKSRLPDYMVPANLVTLSTFPLSANGKLDRKALPQPELTITDVEPPQSQTEQTLAGLWQELLKVEQVSRNDNFFALGGHSLLGIHLVHRIQQAFGQTLPVSAVFESGTLAELARTLDTGGAKDKPPLLAMDRGQIVPQSWAQQRLWFLYQLDPDSSAYHLPGALRLKGSLDESALDQALVALARRHESLRTRFRQGTDHDGTAVPLQEVLSEPVIMLEQDDLRAGNGRGFGEGFRSFCQRPFALEASPPWRVRLVRTGTDEWCLLLCMHHIISDGWSLQVMLEELLALYRSECGGEGPLLAPLVAQYPDFALWQRQQVTGEVLNRQLAWWQDQLGDDHPVLDLPTDRPRPARRDGRGERHAFELPDDLVRRLRSFASDQRMTLFAVILTGFEALLYRMTGQSQIRIGVPVAGRDLPGTERLIGFFVNTLVLQADFRRGNRVSDLLAQIRERLKGAQAHADLPFEQLVDALQPERSLSHNPLFQVSCNHQVFDLQPMADVPGLTCESLACPAENAHFDLVLGTQEYSDGSIHAYLDFASDILDRSSVERMAEQWLAILDSMVRKPDARLSELPLLTTDDQQVWQQWNQPAHPPVDPRPICALIAEQARVQPHAVAIVHGEHRLTFAQFNARANQLAHWLIRQGIGAESRVGVALERGADMLVALFAVHKAGAAYVPLDPDYPAARLRYMLEDSGARLLLSHTAAWDRLPPTDTPQVNLDELDLCNESTADPEIVIHPDQLAYLIYTSGSTGQPKGVAVPHGSLSMHCQTIGARYRMTSDDRELHFLSISFDGAHERWLTALSHGARIVLRDQALWSVQQTYDCLRDEGITVAAFPPGYLRQLSEWAELKGDAPGLRVLCFAGEAFSRTMMHHAIRHLKPQIIINGYGPTETVVTPTLWQVSAETADFESAYAPIGDLVGDRQGYVLDDHLNLLPPGIAGELYLGGALARGYLDRPAATAERFVPNPFRHGERLYRTGDRVRLNRDGQLEYLGRLDQQIKLRGYRIETGEVEAALKACPGVRDVVALVRDTAAGHRLVGYVCVEELDEKTLKAQLKERLPDYMVPSHLVLLEQLPLLPNGKLDRNALPEPQIETTAYQAPSDAREKVLAELWQNILGVEQVGRDDNFFALGGDSIQSLGLITRLREAGWQLSARSVFLSPRLADMAAALEPLAETDVNAQCSRASGELPLTPIQAHFFEQPARNLHHWNQSVLLAVHQPLNTDHLRAAVAAVISHHDSFRLAFRQEPSTGRWLSHYRPDEPLDRIFRTYRLSRDESVTALCDRIQRSFHLNDGPLAAVALIHCPDGQQRLFLCAHHLMVDGVSWRILLEDLVRAYTQLEAGQPVSLTPTGAGYQQWAESLSQAAAAGQWAEEVHYWTKIAGQRDPWPVDNPDGRAHYCDSTTVSRSLSAEQTRQLLRKTLAAHGAGMDEMLLAALADALNRWGGLSAVLVAVEGHGREPVFPAVDCSRTLGWFTCLYPMILKSVSNFADTLRHVRRSRAELPGKGIGFGALRYLAEPEVRARLAAIGEPLVAFNYLGQLDGQTGERFSPAPESPGAAVDPQTPMARELEVTGQILEGKLTLNLQYSSQRYRQRTIQRLLDNLMDRLEAVIDSSRTVVSSAQAPAALKAVNESARPENGPRPLVRLADNAHPGGPGLFCPHPVSGTVVGYYPLAATLSPDWQVWGIQNRQILDRYWRDTSLAAMAEDYVHFVLSQQPEGSIHLVGWSMGGALALEMAALLEQRGRSVAFVGLIDPYVPGAGERRAQAVNAPVPADVHQDQWQQLLALEHHLRALAIDHRRIPPVAAPVHVWWARRSPESNRGGEALLEQFLGRPPSSSVWFDEDHLSIVKSGQLKTQLRSQLARCTVGSSTPETQNVNSVGT